MSTSDKPLRIDIPVELTEEKVCSASVPWRLKEICQLLLFHLHLVVSDIAEWNAKAQVVAIFHTNAGHVSLHDGAYNADRNVSTGNPYKELLADLSKRDVQIELCGATAKAHHWGAQICFPESRSTGMPWRERRSSFKKDL